ncbi:hypothetical protein DERF_001671 [Dermatophagoides farinae]|uniref:Uncharacterized protein n=1 Tax=Dermatophagoides farinae TaxID=6954 RepID=A0A922L9M4_DERFA|nr:hypothetical protein DERF_001671 [Dermatophagoides farinae]
MGCRIRFLRFRRHQRNRSQSDLYYRLSMLCHLNYAIDFVLLDFRAQVRDDHFDYHHHHHHEVKIDIS